MQITGFVKKYIYSGGDFRIARFLQKSPTWGEVRVAGALPSFEPNEEVELHGEWLKHPKHGDQFKVEAAFRVQPENIDGLEKYLANGVPGVGPKKAKLLIKKFGAELIHILSHNHKKLTEVPGIGETSANRIAEGWKADAANRQIALYLSEIDVQPHWAPRIYKDLGAGAVAKIKQNPYLLVEVAGIGFKRADEIAGKMGWDGESPQRAEYVLIYTLEKAASEGHCYLERNDLIAQAETECKVKPALAEEVLDKLLKNGRLIRESVQKGPHSAEPIYTPRLYRAEKGAAEGLIRLIKSPVKLSILPGNLRWIVAECEKDLGVELTDEQRTAVITALSSPVSVLTGGPGTGKTATLKVLVHVAKRLGHTMTLCAPTGRAAKHMSSIVDEKASTIHMAYKYSSELGSWIHNANNPLTTDITVMDESSMADIDLAYRVIDAQPPGKPILFVGDKDQLPSVAPGRVLDDLIASKQVPVTTLTQIFRQAANSNIIQNAHRVLRGEDMVFPLAQNQMILTDCYLQEPPEVDNPEKPGKKREDPEWIKKRILLLCRDRIPARLGLDPIKDIQVLTPMKDGICGVHDLNKTLQDALNPIDPALSEDELKTRRLLWGTREFRVNDRVLVMKNNYAIDVPNGVFNGDIGIIDKIDLDEGVLHIDFYGRMVQYPFEELDALSLGYSMSIHKSQGSEAKAVIVVLLKRNFIMLARNLLYTAATRAKNMLVFVSLRWTLSRAAQNVVIDKRKSNLSHRLRATAEQEKDKELLAACPL